MPVVPTAMIRTPSYVIVIVRAIRRAKTVNALFHWIPLYLWIAILVHRPTIPMTPVRGHVIMTETASPHRENSKDATIAIPGGRVMMIWCGAEGK